MQLHATTQVVAIKCNHILVDVKEKENILFNKLKISVFLYFQV